MNKIKKLFTRYSVIHYIPNNNHLLRKNYCTNTNEDTYNKYPLREDKCIEIVSIQHNKNTPLFLKNKYSLFNMKAHFNTKYEQKALYSTEIKNPSQGKFTIEVDGINQKNALPIISDMVSNLIDRYEKYPGRIIYEDVSKDIYFILEQLAPQKLNINTMTEVTNAFYNVFDSKDIRQGESKNIYFEYDGVMWMGTVDMQLSPWKNKGNMVLFTNYRLTNDSFFYTQKYKGELIQAGKYKYNSLDENEENVSKFLRNLFELFVPHEFPLGEIKSKYEYDEQRVQIQFWSQDEKKCIAVHFENGYHLGASVSSGPEGKQQHNSKRKEWTEKAKK